MRGGKHRKRIEESALVEGRILNAITKIEKFIHGQTNKVMSNTDGQTMVSQDTVDTNIVSYNKDSTSNVSIIESHYQVKTRPRSFWPTTANNNGTHGRTIKNTSLHRRLFNVPQVCI